LSTLSFWKISPPLIRKVLGISIEGNGFSHVIFVEISRFLWKYDSTASRSKVAELLSLWARTSTEMIALCPILLGLALKLHVLFFSREILIDAQNSDFEKTHVSSKIVGEAEPVQP
jgi:hypothetical protein